MKKKLYIVLIFVPVVLAISVVILFSMSKEERKSLPALTDPKIIVKKSERRLYLYSNGQLVRTYKIALGSNPDEDKNTEGDGCTPLGEFYVFTKNNKSSFYLSLGLSYPNIEDAKRGLSEGLITKDEHDAIVTAINEKKMPPQNTALGGEIYIHGGPMGNTTDWTAGCVALNNDDIKEIFETVPTNTTVVIEP